MSDWVWSIAYGRDRTPSIVLSDRNPVGTAFDVLGAIALNISGRRLPGRVGMLFHRAAQRLLDAAERHTRTLAKVPVGDDLLDTLRRLGLVDADEQERPDWRERARARVGDQAAARMAELMAAPPLPAEEFDEAMRRNKAEAEAHLDGQSRGGE